MHIRSWLVNPQDNSQILISYDSMFPETSAEFWGKDVLKPGDEAHVVVFEAGKISPKRYYCVVSRDHERTWVKRISVE